MSCVFIREILKSAPCELYKGMNPNIYHLMFSNASALSLITERITLEILALKLMKVYSYDNSLLLKFLEYLMNEPMI